MSRPEFVEVDASGVTVEVTMPLRHLCPFKDEVDHGHVTFTWMVGVQTLELHSLRDWLAGFADCKVSHEELTRALYDQLRDAGCRGVEVTTTWQTAGGQVTCRA